MMPGRDIQRRATPADTDALSDVHPVLARVYAARGASSPMDLELPLSALLPVRSLGGVEAAAALLEAHRESHVLVVGDFDADGATSTALMLRVLRQFGFASVDFLVPNRFEFGYGLSAPLADVALGMAPSLVITVDNGIASHDGVARLRAAAIDVLVTDHHLPGETLPDANVIVNPNNPGEQFRSKALAGVGVAFYVLAALERRLVAAGAPQHRGVTARYLDLVALGTVADVVPLDRNNRILVHAGLRRIRELKACPGVLALLADAGRDARRCVATDLGFGAGPRLNAAGRLEDMSEGILTLLADDPGAARRRATALGAINRDRRDLQQRMQEDAREALPATDSNRELPDCVCLFQSDWHQGVVGLVASFLRERCQRPAFAFAPGDGDELKGSGRSIAAVHLRDLLAAVDARHPGLIARFGGHAMAAGLTLARHRFDDFRAACNDTLAVLYPDAQFGEAWLSDGELADTELTIEMAEELREAGPFGAGFDEPLFDGLFRVENARQVGDTHLKLRLTTATSASPIDAIAFRQAEHLPLPLGCWVKVVYRLDVNEFQGIRRAQLIVEQLERVAGQT
ncbi:MAG: single-stranded-DNA-specific exonuclease RecJ [Pseudomonadota bacterium]